MVVDIEQRLARLEHAQRVTDRNHTDLSQALTRTVEHLKQMDERTQILETDRQERRVVEAAAGVENKQLRSDVHNIKEFMETLRDQNVIGKVNAISEGFNKLFWLVISAIVTGGIALLFLVLRGGV